MADKKCLLNRHFGNTIFIIFDNFIYVGYNSNVSRLEGAFVLGLIENTKDFSGIDSSKHVERIDTRRTTHIHGQGGKDKTSKHEQNPSKIMRLIFWYQITKA